MDGGAWWATICGVTQSWTRLSDEAHRTLKKVSRHERREKQSLRLEEIEKRLTIEKMKQIGFLKMPIKWTNIVITNIWNKTENTTSDPSNIKGIIRKS